MELTVTKKKKYKKTEVGRIPKDWITKQIKEIANISTGDKNTEDKIQDGKYPFFVRSDRIERINSYSFDGESVLTAGDGVGTGKVFHYINGKFDFHQRVYRISNFHSDVNGYFFYLYFSHNFYNRVMGMTAKSSVDSVRLEMISDMQIPLPPTLEEQQSIAEVFSDVNDLIRSLDTLIEKKSNIKKGAMQQLLTGKRRLEGFSGEWEVKKLGDIGEFSKGKGIKKKEVIERGLPCIRYGEIYTQHHDYIKKFKSFISYETAKNSKRVRTGDLLFAGSGETKTEIGKCVAYVGCQKVYAGGDIVIFSPNKGNSFFFGYLLNTDHVQKQKASMAQGDAVVHLYARHLSEVIISVPSSVKEQQAIAEVLTSMDEELQSLHQKRDKYKQIKQGMMQELLTGKTRLVPCTK